MPVVARYAELVLGPLLHETSASGELRNAVCTGLLGVGKLATDRE